MTEYVGTNGLTAEDKAWLYYLEVMHRKLESAVEQHQCKQTMAAKARDDQVKLRVHRKAFFR